MRAAIGIIAIAACGHPTSSTPAPAGSAASLPDFTAAHLPAGGGPGSVELADLDGDHRLDIVVANTTDGSVSVLLSRGGRRFEPAPGSPFPCGQQPNDVAIADVDGDGHLDLVIANHDERAITILAGDGKGGFRPAVGSPVAVVVKPHTHGVAVADFDGDGHADLATDSWGEDKILIMHGDGDGNFARPQYVDTGKHPYQRLRAADLDGDGRPDLVTTDLGDDAVTILRNDGKGGFTRADYPGGHEPFGAAIGDLDGDGHLDLAVIDSPGIVAGATGPDALSILLGDGKGAFARVGGPTIETGQGPSRVAIGDLDGDGRGDVVVTTYKSADAWIYFMGPHGVPRAHITARIGRESDGVAIGDLDGDGKRDLAATSVEDNTLTILYQR